MTDLQILDTYGYTMCPARSEFPTLDSMPRFVRGHADSGDGSRRIDRLGERQFLRHRVVVVGQHAVGADNLYVGDTCPAQQGRPRPGRP